MKNLQQYLNEGHKSTYDKTSYESSESHAVYKQYAIDYLAALNKGDKLRTCIIEAIKQTNKILDIFYTNKISKFLSGQMIGKFIETSLSENMTNVNGFKFSHGQENGIDKDIKCGEVPSGFTINGLGSSINDSIFDIEVKTSKSNKFTGNKSYAQDVNSNKNKDSFYILIKYKLSKELPEDNEQNTNEKNFRFNIISLEAYFCYLTQNDWWYGDKGNAASLKTGVLKDKRLIEIIGPSKSKTT